MIEAVDKCSDIESAVADKIQVNESGEDTWTEKTKVTTWNGGSANGLKHGLCFYDYFMDYRCPTGHDQTISMSWKVYNNDELVWEENIH